MLDSISREHGSAAKRAFLAVRAKQLAAHSGELKTKRQVLDAMRRSYEKLLAQYLRVEGTTYAGWSKHGAQPDWDEVVAAAADDAVWDRLVERVVEEAKPR